MDSRMSTVLAIAEAGTFSKAAENLALTQPAVSHQVSLLEEELGVKIFIRGRRSLDLTPEGEIVLKYARRMKAMDEAMAEELKSPGSDVRRLRVGITHTSESNKVSTTLARYSSEHPGMNITIVTDTVQKLYAMLDSYQLDLAIVDDKPRMPSFDSFLLDRDFLVCVMSPENPLAARAQVSLSDLRRQKLILRLPGSETRTQVDNALAMMKSSTADFNVMMEIDNIATIKECVRKDLGVSILANSACVYEVRKKKLVVRPVENLSMEREQHVVFRNDDAHIGTIRELFADALKKMSQAGDKAQEKSMKRPDTELAVKAEQTSGDLQEQSKAIPKKSVPSEKSTKDARVVGNAETGKKRTKTEKSEKAEKPEKVKSEKNGKTRDRDAKGKAAKERRKG